MKNIDKIPEKDLFFFTLIKIKKELDKLFGENYNFSIWNKNGRNDIEVNYNDKLYKFKFYSKNDIFWIEEDKK